MTQQTVIQQELEALQKQISTLRQSLAEKPDYGLGKGDPAITRWELDRAMLEQLEERATELKNALDRVDEGTYGICSQCHQPIHPDRLAVLPDTKICVQCARKN